MLVCENALTPFVMQHFPFNDLKEIEIGREREIPYEWNSHSSSVEAYI